jgi:uncharacterized protein involved in exopolysaccharide biosynthesis
VSLGQQSNRDIREAIPVVAERYQAPGTLPSTSLGREPVPFVLDLEAVAVSLKTRARAIAIGTLLGAATGAAIVAFVPPRFDGRAMLLIRTTSIDPLSAATSKMGPLAELIPGALGGNTDADLSTELALLESRATLGTVVDSLRMQVVPASPGRVPAASIVDSLRLNGRFKPSKVSLTPGRQTVPLGSIWASRPAKVKLLDREDAIDQLDERLNVRRIAGNAVEITYAARDSVSAAQVPNLVANIYMARRLTVDRGLNQRRLEFLNAKADSIRGDLRSSADVLAATSQRSGVSAAPEIGARALADESTALESRLAEIRATERALDSLLKSGSQFDVRSIAGFPDLLRSPAINEILSQMAKVNTERTVLLARVPENHPQAVAYARAADSLAALMTPIATSYRNSIGQQRASLERDLQRVGNALFRFPVASSAVLKDQAEVERLAAINLGMGAQVMEARLAAMLEGGDVRVVDAAVSPRKVSFPRPTLTLATFTFLGLLAGVAYALLGLRRGVTTGPVTARIA